MTGRVFRFGSADKALDIDRLVAGNRSLARLRARLRARHAARGERMLEDLVVVGLRRAGDHYVAIRGAQIDHVIQVRNRLEATYARLTDFGDGPPPDIDALVQQLGRDYAELDRSLTALTEPVAPPRVSKADADRLVQEAANLNRDPATGQPHAPFPEQDTQSGGRAIAEDLRDQRGRGPNDAGYNFAESRIANGSKQWRQDPTRPGVFVRAPFADGSTGELSIETINGADRYVLRKVERDGTPVVIREEGINIDPYARKVYTTSLLNAHHGVQADPMERRFGSLGYNRHAAPTIWLRNSVSGSPHRRITSISGRIGKHPSEPGTKLTPAELATVTYAEMRRTAAREMRSVGVSEDAVRGYLAAHDAYVRNTILTHPKFPKDSAGRRALLGDWEPTVFEVPQ